MKINETKVKAVTLPPNQMTSPYAYKGETTVCNIGLKTYNENDRQVFKYCVQGNA